MGLVLGLLYCCCCAGGAGATENHDDYSDEENRYSTDDSIGPTKPAPQLSSENLKRNSSSKSIFTMFNILDLDLTVGRSLSRKKLTLQRNGDLNLPSDAMMFPITELDNRLDPRTMFLNNNVSGKSLDDDVDYLRRLKVVN